MLAYLLEAVLIMAHPFAPFITETIWQTLDWENGTVLAGKVQRAVINNDRSKAMTFAEVKNIVTEVRYIVKTLKVKDASLCYKDDAFVHDNAATIARLAGLKEVIQAKPQPGNGLPLTNTRHECWLSISQAVSQRYFKDIQAKQGHYINTIKQLKTRLDNQAYVKNAPDAVVEQTKGQLKEAHESLAAIEVEMQKFTIRPENVEDAQQPPADVPPEDMPPVGTATPDAPGGGQTSGGGQTQV